MMSLDEAIKQYEQFLNICENHNLTESQEVQEVIEQLTTELREWREPRKVDSCDGRVKEFDKRYLLVIKQLVAWLKELKERREQPKEKLLDDGTLAIQTNYAMCNITRVYVRQDGTHFADLFYRDED
jgi:hypothetical protein